MSGHTLLTRLLFGVMNGKLYKKKKFPLYRLLEHWANQLAEAFETGIEITICKHKYTIYPTVLGAKGDWVDLIKIGRLSRHFLRESPKNQDPPGVCHLCQAGRVGYPWHLNQVGCAWLRDPPDPDDLPWTTPSPLLRIPHDSGPRFFLIDVFHSCHKGVVGDMIASAIVPLPIRPAFIHKFGIIVVLTPCLYSSYSCSE